ncbi:MAG: MoxR family ATPase [Anaerolineae bacterium]|nr:MoxR family ATPase [Anaerolineae bacterium]
MLSVTPSELLNLLKSVALVRPVFIWGPPGIGKSALVEQFAMTIGLECVSLLGSQLAPEDLIGVPQIIDGKSRFCTPIMIARSESYVLFLDELNACTPEVQKAFYSLIHDRRIGEYRLPAGSIVIGAGNRKQDKALARPIASALVNRLIHVELEVNTDEWLEWGRENNIHNSILQYIQMRPDQLLAPEAQDDTPFTTPRSWHMLSDALHSWSGELNPAMIQVLASGCLSAQHAGQYAAFARNWMAPYKPEQILSGEEEIPFGDYEEVTFMLASVRAHLIDHLPRQAENLNNETEWMALQAIELLEKTAQHDMELVRYFITPENEDHLPKWFVEEITRLWSDLLQIPEPPPPPPFTGFTPPAGSRFARPQPPAGSSTTQDNTTPPSRFGSLLRRSPQTNSDDTLPASPFRQALRRPGGENDNDDAVRSRFGTFRRALSDDQEDAKNDQ